MKVDTSKISRAWLLSDIHFGVRSSSLEWLEIHKDYFNNFFIPKLKEHKKDGDALFILGDIFESRQSLNILVLNETFKIIKSISDILPIVMIVGNHDIYRKNTNDVNSAIIFENLSNVDVLIKPQVINLAKGTAFMMPWVEDKTKEVEVIREHPADYMFCHSDFHNMQYNKRISIEEGIDPEVVDKFKRVYSGHIHYAQTIRNIRMIGCPFQMTRSDIGNNKGLHIIDFETNEEVSFENDHSPKFLKFNIDNILDLTVEQMRESINNNFVDIIVDGKWVSKFPFSTFADSMHGHKRLEYILSSLQTEYEDEDYDGEEINLEDLIAKYCEETPYTQKTKDDLLTVSLRLYRKAVKMSQEKEKE